MVEKTSAFSDRQRRREREWERNWKKIAPTSCFSLPIWLSRSGLLDVLPWQPEQSFGDEVSATSEYDRRRTANRPARRAVPNTQQSDQCCERVHQSTHLHIHERFVWCYNSNCDIIDIFGVLLKGQFTPQKNNSFKYIFIYSISKLRLLYNYKCVSVFYLESFVSEYARWGTHDDDGQDGLTGSQSGELRGFRWEADKNTGSHTHKPAKANNAITVCLRLYITCIFYWFKCNYSLFADINCVFLQTTVTQVTLWAINAILWIHGNLCLIRTATNPWSAQGELSSSFCWTLGIFKCLLL